MLTLWDPLYHCVLDPVAILDRRRDGNGAAWRGKGPNDRTKDADDRDPRSRTAGR